MTKPKFKIVNPQWTKHMDRIAELSDNDRRQSNATFTVLRKDLDSPFYAEHGCHSMLGSAGNHNSDWVVSCVWSGHKHTHSFIHWLINSKQYSSYIVNKTVPDVFRRGLIITSDTPANLLSQICVITRQLWEHPDVVHMWHLIKSAKVAPDLAFALAHSFILNVEGNVVKARRGGLHDAMNHNYMNGEFFRNFLNNTPKNLRDSYRKDVNYRGVFAIWSYNYDMPQATRPIPETFSPVIDDIPLEPTRSIEKISWGDVHEVADTNRASFKRQIKKIADNIEKEYRNA